ncbi:alpha-L-fucosidase [Aestuariivivens sp. NBU2969]|uniref:alpha-L-fucosidase n=1 Tax=Aestuariivivens sp. NBU2969 TaxID=2873267 RepID=UPI001CBDC5C0|nr:alpha-L-fucosidase [Aestuariivivens sp. NBU2969]
MNFLTKKHTTPVILMTLCALLMFNCISNAPIDAPKPFLPVPNKAQLNWHKAEYIMFVHFGMKTFYPSNDHMGYGDEDPAKFNPVKFNAKQWVEAAKAGGFKGIVLTTKHHDGFCNWQSELSPHNVKKSPWKDGQGDIIKELAEACREGGVYFGIYVSLIDKYYEKHIAGDYSGYDEYYYNQIKELSTKYGTIDEYWFDGYKANNLNIDYKRISDLIKKEQPNAVIYDSGTMVEHIPDRCIAFPGNHGGITPDQNYRVEINDTLRWYPSEPSIILQGNWFHNNTPVVSLEKIQDYYLTSVGYGVTPLMNISPNTDGLIDEETVERLVEFKTWVDQLHGNDLTKGKNVKVSATSFRGKAKQYAPKMIIDDNYDTFFATNDEEKNAVIEIDLGEKQEIDGFIIQEYIPLGQRIDGYTIECRVDGKWKTVFSGKKIGYKRIILEGRASATDIEFPKSDGIRLKIENALACPLISTFQIVGNLKN